MTVIVPFAGPESQLDRLVADLERLERRSGDELIVVDNSPRSSPRDSHRNGVRVLRARAIRSPGFARNAGARVADTEWLVFVDGDTEPAAELLDALFDPPPEDTTAVLAGAIVDVAARPTLVARYVAAHARTSQQITLGRRGRGYAQTANCAMRRSAFDQVGGFDETIRTGEDADICFRLELAGWTIEERPNASVNHHSRATIPALLSQLAGHGSGAAWLNQHYPGEFPAPRPRELLMRTPHYLRAATTAAARGDRETALFELIELSGQFAFDLGRLLPNRPR